MHHTVTLAPDLVVPWDDEYRAMRLLERIGVERFGSGMSYNVAVMPSGNAYLGQPLDNKTTHSAYLDWNYTRASIVLVGDYARDKPTEAMLRKVSEIQAMWFERGTISKTPLRWHGQVQGTECPGQWAKDRVPDINKWAAALEDNMANLFDTRAEFRSEVRLAVEAELNEQWPSRTAEVVRATVEALVPMIPGPVDVDSLVQRITAEIPKTFSVTQTLEGTAV